MKNRILLGVALTLVLNVFSQKAPSKKWTYKEVETVIYSEDSTEITGSLLVPKCALLAPKQQRAVLIIGGSGAADLNGNVGFMRPDTYKYLAYELSKKGIISWRYNKRILSKGVKESDLLFEDLVKDAQAGIRFLLEQKNVKSVDIIGHSQGALVGALALINQPNYSNVGLISLSGTAQNAADLIRKQIEEQNPNMDAEERAILNDYLNRLKNQQKIDEPKGKYKAMFRTSVQDFMMSWFKYNPTEWYAKLNHSVLIIQGDNDLQIKPKEAELLHSACPQSDLIIIPKMNHILKICSENKSENLKSYYQVNQAISEELVDKIASFVKRRKN